MSLCCENFPLKNSCPEPFHGRLHQRLADPLSAHSASHWVEWFQFFVGCNACVSALPPSACVPWPSQRLWDQIVMPGYLEGMGTVAESGLGSHCVPPWSWTAAGWTPRPQSAPSSWSVPGSKSGDLLVTWRRLGTGLWYQNRGRRQTGSGGTVQEG